MKDLIGKDLFVGDYVIIIEKKYRTLKLARVLKFTPKQTKVLYLKYNGEEEEFLTDQIVKVLEKDLLFDEKKQKLDLAFNKKPF